MSANTGRAPAITIECVGAVADADGVRRTRGQCELPLEGLDLGTEHEPSAIDDTLDGVVDLRRFLGEMKIQKRNVHATGEGVGVGSSRYSRACAR